MSPSCTVFEILTFCQKFKTSRDLNHANLGDSWSCNAVSWNLVKFCTNVRRIALEKACKREITLENDLQIHSRSLTLVPFDRPYTISNQSSIESMSLSCTVFEILTLICPKFRTVTWPWPRPFQGRIVVRRLKLDIAYSHTKFDDSSCSRSRDI